jgi:hypothetical protein
LGPSNSSAPCSQTAAVDVPLLLSETMFHTHIEPRLQTKIWFIMRKLRGDSSLLMLATIQSRTYCLLICFQKTVAVPVVLYGCETWSLMLWKDETLRVMKRIFGRKGSGMMGGSWKLHNKELCNLYPSQV